RRVLPLARRAGGLRAPSRPRRDHAGLAEDVAPRRRGGGDARRRGSGRVPGWTQMKGERPVVPKAEFTSYYGMPVLNAPVWKSVDIAGYLFVGGLSGASSVLAAGAQATGRDELSTRTKVVATGSIALAAAALIHDLGRPARFVNMLRVVKPSSPMSMGSWLLAAYGPL